MRLEYEGLTGKIIGAAVDVHKNLGPGFIESVYENALCVELRSRAVSFHRQLAVPVLYRSVEVGQHRLDLFVDGKLIREFTLSFGALARGGRRYAAGDRGRSG